MKAFNIERKVLELSDGELGDAWQGLGWALSGLGQNKEAIDAFRNYLRSGDVPAQYRIKVEQQIEKLEGRPRGSRQRSQCLAPAPLGA